MGVNSEFYSKIQERYDLVQFLEIYLAAELFYTFVISSTHTFTPKKTLTTIFMFPNSNYYCIAISISLSSCVMLFKIPLSEFVSTVILVCTVNDVTI